MNCERCTKILTGKQTKYCSYRCKNAHGVHKRRKKLKELSLDYKGRECSKCGYNRCVAALHFHHFNKDKEFGIAENGLTRSWEKVREELDKCIVLCANCHAETHSGVV